jgi:hypothetical protein
MDVSAQIILKVGLVYSGNQELQDMTHFMKPA